MNNRLYINYRTPKEIEIIIKKSVRGQDEGVKTVATALSAHLLRIRYAQSHPGRELQNNLVLEDRKKGLDRPYGRPRAVLSETFAGNYKLWKGGKLTAVDFMKKENLPRTTFYRLVKRYEKQ